MDEVSLLLLLLLSLIGLVATVVIAINLGAAGR